MEEKISDILTKFIESKQRLSELEKKVEKYRTIVEKYMVDKDRSEIDHSIDGEKYSIKKTMSQRTGISKKDLPSEIWDKYHSTSRFNIITVSKKK